MNNLERKLIERDKDYLHVKKIILHNMNKNGETPFLTDDEWEMLFVNVGKIKARKAMRYMLDDPEIQREYDRNVFPIKSRWVLKEK